MYFTTSTALNVPLIELNLIQLQFKKNKVNTLEAEWLMYVSVN